MGKRQLNDSDEGGPNRKKIATSNAIEPGDILLDITGKEWRLGQPVGEGAFGEIFMASDCTLYDVSEQSPYVAKVELHSNGPLFVETHFYLRAGKIDLINKWKQKKKKTDGLPYFIASGSHTKMSKKYRFLILPRYSIDLQQILEQHGNKFNVKTVLTIALQLIDTLEYIHSCGFIHADIKASNILINEKPVPPPVEESLIINHNKSSPEVRKARCVRSCRVGRTCRNVCLKHCRIAKTVSTPMEVNAEPVNCNQVYLLDYGLSSKYLQSNCEHKQYCVDERKAHAGTILFCSLDAHHGVQSRRSDLESMGYNMIYWLTNILPWMHKVEEYEVVKSKKQMCMQELEKFLRFCFGKYVPVFLKKFFQHINCLAFEEKPDYDYCRRVFMQGYSEYHYKKVFTLDFDNKDGWGSPRSPSRKQCNDDNCENERQRASEVCSILRTPLKSNVPGKHVLRQKDKSKSRMMRWSKILIDPELIIKSGRIREKEQDENDHFDGMENINILDLNPTETMLDVYNAYLERQRNNEIKEKSNNSPVVIEGYNATMMAIYNRILERENCNTELLIKHKKGKPRKNANSCATDKKLKPSTGRYNTRLAKRTC